MKAVERKALQEYYCALEEENTREVICYDFFEDGWESDYFQPLEVPFWEHGIRFVSSYDEAEQIQQQYADAISRTSDYVCETLYWHLLSGNAHVLDVLRSEDYVCGFEKAGVFIVSHFAPRTIKSGVKMIKALAYSDIPIVVATLPYQANQLKKAGFRKVCEVPQFFAGEIVTKEVMVNNSVTSYHLVDLVDEL